MNKSTILSLIDIKIAEMESNLAALLANPEISENTKRTQKFQRTTTIRQLSVTRAFVEMIESDDITLKGDLEKWFTSMITLTETRKGPVVKVAKGDTLIGLINKYKDVKDVYAKIMKAAEASGLTLNVDHFE